MEESVTFSLSSITLLTVLSIVVSTVRYLRRFSTEKFPLGKCVATFVRTSNGWFEFSRRRWDIAVAADRFRIDVQSSPTSRRSNWRTAVGKNNRTSSTNTSNNASACWMCERTWWVTVQMRVWLAIDRRNERMEREREGETNGKREREFSFPSLFRSYVPVGGIPSCSNMIWSFFVFLWSSFSSGSDILFCSVSRSANNIIVVVIHIHGNHWCAWIDRQVSNELCQRSFQLLIRRAQLGARVQHVHWSFISLMTRISWRRVVVAYRFWFFPHRRWDKQNISLLSRTPAEWANQRNGGEHGVYTTHIYSLFEIFWKAMGIYTGEIERVCLRILLD